MNQAIRLCNKRLVSCHPEVAAMQLKLIKYFNVAAMSHGVVLMFFDVLWSTRVLHLVRTARWAGLCCGTNPPVLTQQL